MGTGDNRTLDTDASPAPDEPSNAATGGAGQMKETAVSPALAIQPDSGQLGSDRSPAASEARRAAQIDGPGCRRPGPTPAHLDSYAGGLIAFGGMIGILAGLSTAAGTTVTLLGLLFALMGGTFLDWFDKNRISEGNRPLLLHYSGRFSAGVLAGLLVSFALRAADQAYLQPYIIARQLENVPEELRPAVAVEVVKKFEPGKIVVASTQGANEKRDLARVAAKDLDFDSGAKGLDASAMADLKSFRDHLNGIADLLESNRFRENYRKHAGVATKEKLKSLFPNISLFQE